MTLQVKIEHPTTYPAKAEVSVAYTDGQGKQVGEASVVATLAPGEHYIGHVHQNDRAGAVLIVREVQ